MTTEEQAKTAGFIDGYTDEITDELSEDGGTVEAKAPEPEKEIKANGNEFSINTTGYENGVYVVKAGEQTLRFVVRH